MYRDGTAYLLDQHIGQDKDRSLHFNAYQAALQASRLFSVYDRRLGGFMSNIPPASRAWLIANTTTNGIHPTFAVMWASERQVYGCEVI